MRGARRLTGGRLGSAGRRPNRALGELRKAGREAAEYKDVPGYEVAALRAGNQFDNSARAIGTTGLNTGGAGIVTTPSSEGGAPGAGGGGVAPNTPFAGDTNTDAARQQTGAQQSAMGGTGMMIAAGLMFIAGLAMIYSGWSSTPPNIPLIIAGIALVLAGIAMFFMGRGSGGQGARDAGQNLDQQGQSQASDSANQTGQAIDSSGGVIGGGDRARSGAQQEAARYGQELQSIQDRERARQAEMEERNKYENTNPDPELE